MTRKNPNSKQPRGKVATAIAPTRRTKPKDPNRYPKGWNRQKVQKVLEHYENQTEDEAVAEDEAAWRDGGYAMIQVPIALVPAVQKLLAKRAG